MTLKRILSISDEDRARVVLANLVNHKFETLVHAFVTEMRRTREDEREKCARVAEGHAKQAGAFGKEFATAYAASLAAETIAKRIRGGQEPPAKP